MSVEIDYPIAIKHVFYNPSKRRRNGKGAKGHVIYGYDRNGRFHTRRISTLEAYFNRPNLFRLRKGRCIDCGRPATGFFEKKLLSFLVKKPNIRCNKCSLDSV